MFRKFLFLVAISSLALVTHGKPSADETALISAILSIGPATYILRKNIVLTQNLPPLGDGKDLTVTSAAITGAPFKIDGANEYFIFWGYEVSVNLTLTNIILTRSTNYAVYLQGKSFPTDDRVPLPNNLRVSKVKFIKNNGALFLNNVNTVIDNCLFTAHASTSVYAEGQTQGRVRNTMKITSTTFSKNPVIALEIGSTMSLVTIDASKFISNSGVYGSAILVPGGVDSKLDITNTEFTGNSAVYSGGAIYFAGRTPCSGTNLTFKRNVAEYENGGAVAMLGIYGNNQTSMLFKSSKFIANTALRTSGGGAFHIDSDCSVNFCSCTFSGNRANGTANNGNAVGNHNKIGADRTIPLLTGAPKAQLLNLTRFCKAA